MSEKTPPENEKQGKNKKNEPKTLPDNKKQGKNKKNEPKSPHYKLLSGVKLDKTEKYNYQKQNNRLQ